MSSPLSLIQPQKAAHLKDVQCWAHTKYGTRCTSRVKSREGEPIPIPYCATHLSSGDGAIKMVDHPFAGKCLIAQFDLPGNFQDKRALML
mmetsp:Transcript_61813/g.74377  ORF Transcript_61813/g.74377 Transcript_61813/m.74377 type:complete len:90 (+) Transcript_61813:90-359(+)